MFCIFVLIHFGIGLDSQIKKQKWLTHEQEIVNYYKCQCYLNYNLTTLLKSTNDVFSFVKYLFKH